MTDGHGQTADDMVLRRQVEQWFIRRGVPHFGHYSAEALVPFLLPILLLMFSVEAVALPWFDLQEVVGAVAPGHEDSSLLRPLAAAVVVVALLIALAFALPAINVVIDWTETDGGPPDGLVRRVFVCVSCVVPLVALAVVLDRLGALSSLNGWSVAVLTVLVLAALRRWENGTRTAGVALAAVAFLASLVWSVSQAVASDDDPVSVPVSIIAIVVGLAMLAAGGRPGLAGRRAAKVPPDVRKAIVVPLLLVLVGVQAAIVPHLQSDTVREALATVALGLAVPVVLAVLLAWRASAGLGKGSSWGTAALIAAVFVVVPPLLVPVIENDEISAHVDIAVAMGIANVVGLTVLVGAVSLGLPAVAEWMTGEIGSQLLASARVVRDAGPFLVVFIFFFFFTAETWHVAAKLTWAQFTGLLVLQITAAVAIAMGAMEKDVSAERTWSSLKTHLPSESPVVKLKDDGIRDDFKRRLKWYETVNLQCILLTKWILRMILVAGTIALVLFVLGAVVVREPLLDAWQVHDNETWIALLAQVAAFLGAFAALYFAVEVARDDKRRRVYDQDFVNAVDRRLAVRLAYWWRFDPRSRHDQDDGDDHAVDDHDAPEELRWDPAAVAGADQRADD